MKYVAYVSAALMVFISFIPYFLIREAISGGRYDFDRVIVKALVEGNTFVIPAFFLPMLAVFLGSILIIWVHKECK